jgi:nuclear transport factor 2 (NTF2) superfamily protein
MPEKELILLRNRRSFRENRIAVRFAYEWHDEVGDPAVKEQVFSPTDLHA